MFSTVLSRFITKILKNVKYFKEGVLKYVKKIHEIFKYFKVIYFVVHPYSCLMALKREFPRRLSIN